MRHNHVRVHIGVTRVTPICVSQRLLLYLMSDGIALFVPSRSLSFFAGRDSALRANDSISCRSSASFKVSNVVSKLTQWADRNLRLRFFVVLPIRLAMQQSGTRRQKSSQRLSMYCEWLILTAILVTKLGLRDGEDEETTARADGRTPLAKAIWQWLLTASVRGNES